jgi:hypothetical protein
MGMEKIDKTAAKQLISECKAALQGVVDTHDLELQAKTARYTGTQMTFRFILRTKTTDDDGNQITPEATAFKTKAWVYGLKPTDLGKEFISNGKTFKITGLISRRKKYPIQATCVETGRGFKFGASQVVAALGD